LNVPKGQNEKGVSVSGLAIKHFPKGNGGHHKTCVIGKKLAGRSKCGI
jgi:hypothetical protein